MIIGFTGTQVGMNQTQKDLVRAFLNLHQPSSVIHGDCVGADKDFDDICAELGIKRYSCPSNLTAKRAYTEAIVLGEPAPPLERNLVIVSISNELMACPEGLLEIIRSGTWATIRYAKNMKKTAHIFYSNGVTEKVGN